MPAVAPQRELWRILWATLKGTTTRGNNDTVRVHRLLAVSEYGLSELKGKEVHHKNGIKWDNRPENLEIMTKEEHASHHLNNRDIVMSNSTTHKKGAKYERELRNNLENMGFPCLRMPASGASTTDDLPDLFSRISKNEYLAIEVKYTSKGGVYVKEYELNSLKRFSEMWGAVPLVAVRFSSDTNFYCIDIRTGEAKDRLTDSGNLSTLRSRRDEYENIESLLSNKEPVNEDLINETE